MQKLETVTNVAVLVAALLVGAYFVGLFIGRFGSSEPPDRAIPGTRLALPEAFDFTAHDRTLILAIQEDCSYCESSMPFYKNLAAKVGGGCAEYGVVAVLPNPPAAADALLRDYELEIPRLANISLVSLGVTGTPTLVLVDGKGTVLDVWVGQLSRDGEQEVLASIDPMATCSEAAGASKLWGMKGGD
jgi:thiol-disulfide isomerase/thioredoxin